MPPIELAGLVATLTTPTAIATVVVGVADMQFLDGTLYGLDAGAGCSHGLAGTANTRIRVHAEASITPVADLSACVQTHLVATRMPTASRWTAPGMAR